MTRNKKTPGSKIFRSTDRSKAENAGKPTAQQQAVLALFRVIEDDLRFDADSGRFSFDYDMHTVEAIRVEPDGRVHAAFTGVISIGLSIEELLREHESDSKDASAILTLLNRPG